MLSVNRILRVDHAGERGAISIYRGQIAVSRLFHPACLAPLSEMLGHERSHYARFDALLKARHVRPCHALALWTVGGWVLGVLTACLGQKAIWACTAAVEHTVNQHLEHQVAFLRLHDAEALAAVEAIRADEQAHEDDARVNGGMAGGAYRLLRLLIASTTSFAIWLSAHL